MKRTIFGDICLDFLLCIYMYKYICMLYSVHPCCPLDIDIQKCRDFICSTVFMEHLSVYGANLGAKDMAINKTDKVPALIKLIF